MWRPYIQTSLDKYYSKGEYEMEQMRKTSEDLREDLSFKWTDWSVHFLLIGLKS